MANLTINRSDLFPIGTSVGAYTNRSRQFGSKPAGTPVETQTVAADGSLTFATLQPLVQYQLWAEVAGQHRYVRVEGPQTIGQPVASWDGRTVQAQPTMQGRVRQRRTLAGA